MEVLRITPRGYCHGVVDAFRIAKRVRESTGEPVHMLGQLVHNTHATSDLQAQGIELVGTTWCTSDATAIQSPRASSARRRAGSTWWRRWRTSSAWRCTTSGLRSPA